MIGLVNVIFGRGIFEARSQLPFPFSVSKYVSGLIKRLGDPELSGRSIIERITEEYTAARGFGLASIGPSEFDQSRVWLPRKKTRTPNRDPLFTLQFHNEF